MQFIDKAITALIHLFKSISMAVLTFMMFFILLAVIMRHLKHSIMGDYELIQILMVVVIMMGLPFVEKINEHIAIGLIVDRLSQKMQVVFDVVAHLLTAAVCLLVGWVNIQHAVATMLANRSTILLKLPLYPFIFIIGIGFILWGIVALLKFAKVFMPETGNPNRGE